jgi:hypothetical protein
VSLTGLRAEWWFDPAESVPVFVGDAISQDLGSGLLFAMAPNPSSAGLYEIKVHITPSGTQARKFAILAYQGVQAY